MMVWWETLLLIEIVHNFFGLAIACCLRCEGFEFVNPNWIYQNYKVNRFGSIFLGALYGSFCPIGTIIYWFYKLCTVGRK